MSVSVRVKSKWSASHQLLIHILFATVGAVATGRGSTVAVLMTTVAAAASDRLLRSRKSIAKIRLCYGMINLDFVM